MNTKKNIFEAYLSRKQRLALNKIINSVIYYGTIILAVYISVYMFTELLFSKI